MVMAKGKATIGTIAVGEKNVKIVMVISKKDFFRNARFFEDTSEEIEFALGDNQMSMADYFDEEAEARQEDARRAAWLMSQPSKIVTVDQSGVVQSLEPVGEGQSEMIVETDGVSDEQEPDGEQEDLEQEESEQEDDDSEPDEAAEGDDLENSHGESEPDAEQDNEHEPTSKEVDAYIIQEQPKYDDIEYDFAELLVRKNSTNETWREIANSFGISTGVLTAQLSEMRKRAKKILMESRAA